MTALPTPAADGADPAVHFTDALAECVERGRRIALKADGDWFGGQPRSVANGVLVLDDPHTHRRFHLRIADIEVLREYLAEDGDPA